MLKIIHYLTFILLFIFIYYVLFSNVLKNNKFLSTIKTDL